MKLSNQQIHKGFTLIETLFAILIFSAALISLLAISSKGISATREVKNETAAYYLAQEGLEVVRNLRDNNFIIGAANWSDGFAGNIDCESAIGCSVEYQSLIPPTLGVSAGDTSDQIMLLSNGTYSNTGGTATGFYRKIHAIAVQNGGPVNEYTIVSTVWWQTKGIRRSVELKTVLKKWQ